ncbi:MAG: F0F1 ATP synthase subunit epsilon [Deltaproteobacteria bacterium]|nr:F0F1 ATP synthase subunit epsilon [Deltaproteobacteria bacterium]
MTQNILQVEVVTPQKVLVEDQAGYVTIPGIMGELGILPGHVPLLTEIKSGVLSYRVNGQTKQVAVHHGYAQVFKDRVTVLGKVAELAEDLDSERAKAAFLKAEENMKKDDQDENALQAKLMRSLTRQQLSSK